MTGIKKPPQPDCSGGSGGTTIIGHNSMEIYRKAIAIIFVGQIVVAVDGVMLFLGGYFAKSIVLLSRMM